MGYNRVLEMHGGTRHNRVKKVMVIYQEAHRCMGAQKGAWGEKWVLEVHGAQQVA